MLGGLAALAGINVNDASRNSARASAACRGLTSVTGMSRVTAVAELTGTVTQLPTTVWPPPFTADQAADINAWINGVSEALNGIRMIRMSTMCSV